MLYNWDVPITPIAGFRMTPDEPDTQTRSDLAALSAAAHGRVIMWPSVPRPVLEEAPEDPARSAKIAELKAQYEAGTLPIDEEAIVAKLLDAMLQDSTRPAEASEKQPSQDKNQV
jgi:anti-sigma28 factor (negative regulator of flagellin synthesis)